MSDHFHTTSKPIIVNHRSAQKAFFLSLFFTIVGIVCWLLYVKDWQQSLPLGIFYCVIVINTYYSVKLFASVTPKDHATSNTLDILLVIAYFFMAFNFDNPLRYVYFDLILFILASTKYTFLLIDVDQPRLLKKKILVDLSGVMMCVLVLGGIVAGYTTLATWLLASVFVIANMLLFFVWPLYKLD